MSPRFREMEMIWAATMAGFGAGLIHVLSGPDHLAAVAPLAVGNGKRSWRAGLQWGLGHCGGVLLIGVLALIFREILPLDGISSSAEKVVGVLLIGVGAWGICKIFSGQLQAPSGAAFGIGVVHGLAGSSHLLGVAPALLFPAPAAVCAYFIAFGGGTIAAMAGFSSVFATLPERLYRSAMALCSFAAVGIGCYWLIA
jgi:hypothetical protein